MHQVHAYDGLVLAKRPLREADAIVLLLTEQGLLRAVARSARAERSKLRYGLEPLTCARFSLVRGKHEWRLTGVEAVSRRYLAGTAARRAALARVSRLLMRLIPGVEPSAALYKTVVEGFDALSSATDAIEPVEVVLVLRILSHLGYLPHSAALAPFIEGGFNIELSAKALQSRALLVRTINESLQATGL